MWIFWVIAGAMAGSVANAVIYRLPRGISWTRGHSLCPHCKHYLGLWDLIPIGSYLGLGGKCRYCKSEIGTNYLVVEVLMAGVFGLIGSVYGWSWVTAGLVVGFWASVVTIIIDSQTRLISEAILIVMVVGAVMYKLGTQNWVTALGEGFGGMLVGMTLVGGVWWVTKKRAMGEGDIELAAVLGAWLGWTDIWLGLWAAFVIGALWGLLIMGLKKAKLKSEIAFGPFLIIGCAIIFIWGEQVRRILGW